MAQQGYGSRFRRVMVLDGQMIEKLLSDHLPMLGQGPTYKGIFAYTRVEPVVLVEIVSSRDY